MIVALLVIVTFLSGALCPPTFPEKLAFDLNELSEEAEAARDSDFSPSASQSSFHGSGATVGSSSSQAPFHESQTHHPAQAEPFWHTSEQFPSYPGPMGALHPFHYTYVPTLVYQPVLVHHPGQPIIPAAEYALPHDQQRAGTRHDASVGSGIHLVNPYFMSPPSIHVPNMALPQHDPPIQFQDRAAYLQGGQRALTGRMRNDFEAGSSGAMQAPETHDSVAILPTDSLTTGPLHPDQSITGPTAYHMYWPGVSILESSTSRRREFGPFPYPSMSANEIREQAVQDPKVFTDSFFRISISEDAEVDRLVGSLSSDSTVLRSTGRRYDSTQLIRQLPKNTKTFLRSYLWNRKKAKQILLQTESGTRSLFFVLLTETQLLPGRYFVSHTSVWEIAHSPETGVFGLHCYGFYPFSETDFLNLERHAESTKRSYWFVSINRYSSETKPSHIAISAAEPDGAHVKESLLATIASAHPETKKLIQTGTLQRALMTSDYVNGKHYYVAEENTPDIRAAIERWKSQAQLTKDAFVPIPLDEKQIEDLPKVAVARYCKSTNVLVITVSDSERYMTDYSYDVKWLHQYRAPTVTIWRLGPEVGGRELLIFKGCFQLGAKEYSDFTKKVSGLRHSTFQYNRLGSL